MPVTPRGGEDDSQVEHYLLMDFFFVNEIPEALQKELVITNYHDA